MVHGNLRLNNYKYTLDNLKNTQICNIGLELALNLQIEIIYCAK